MILLIITFIINTVVHFVGEDTIASWILNKTVIGPLITSLIGLIPNCAASVIITNMYLENVISLGSMISGLLTGAGVGLAVLFKTNNKIKELGKEKEIIEEKLIESDQKEKDNKASLKMIKNLKVIWFDMDFDEQRRIIEHLIDKVVVNDNEINIYYNIY